MKETRMGNWRTVHMTGACDPADLPALRAAADPKDDYSNFGPLSTGRSLCGLNNWPAASIDVIGNLAERGFTPDDVAEHLTTLVEAAPSLIVRIDCGGDYETDEVVNTVIVGEDRTVAVLPPMTDRLPDVTPAQMQSNLLNTLLGP